VGAVGSTIAASIRALIAAVAYAGILVARSAAAVVALTRTFSRGVRLAGERTLARIQSAFEAGERVVSAAIAFVVSTAARSAAAAGTAIRATWHSIRSAFAMLVAFAQSAARAARRAVARTGALVRATIEAGFGSLRGAVALCALRVGAAARGIGAGLRSGAGALSSLATRAGRGVAAGATSAAHRSTVGARGVTAATRSALGMTRSFGRGAGHAARRTATHSRQAAVLSTHLARVAVAATLALARVEFTWLARRMRTEGGRLTSALRHDGHPVVRVAIAGVPAWARQARIVSAFAVMLTVTAGISVGAVMLLLSQRAAPQIASPATSASTLAAASSPLATAAAAPAIEPPSSGRRAGRRPDDSATQTAVAGAASGSAPADTARANARRSLSAARVRDVWSKTDTRSLDRGLASLRSTSLAFQRCDMRKTADDRAVAHCDEVDAGDTETRRVAWTIDFRRDDERWLIDDLSAARPQARSRR
jgi:hypothetical protein